MDASRALLTAAALHAGFQATTTLVVYPALAQASAGRPVPAWAQLHTAHSRRITPVVAVVYGSVLAAWVWVVASGALGPALWVAAAGSLLTGLVTALRAAPTHTRLGREGPRPELLRRLLRADRLRLVGALLTMGGALVAAW